jgi:Class II Aldolase and Adducin N-terminal domain
VHEAYPDIVAMCHAHTVYGVAWAAMGRLLDPITQDACCFFEDHVVIADEGGAVTVECSAGKKVAAAFKGVKAAIHRNHGLMTASRHSIDSAAFWFIALERCRQQQLMIEATGRPSAPATAASMSAATTSAGSTSSRSTTGCCRRTPICLSSPQALVRQKRRRGTAFRSACYLTMLSANCPDSHPTPARQEIPQRHRPAEP